MDKTYSYLQVIRQYEKYSAACLSLGNSHLLSFVGCVTIQGIPHHSGVLPNEAFSHRNGANASPAVRSLQNLKAPSVDGSIRQDALLSDQVAESCPIEPGFPSSKSNNQTDQRKLKVRIKVGSDRTTQRNVAIYSGLGLISPSSSAGNSPEESGGISCEPHEIPDESPSRILEVCFLLFFVDD